MIITSAQINRKCNTNRWKLYIPKYIVFKSINPPTCSNDSFWNAMTIPNIYVPDDSVNAYKTAQYWTKAASKIKPLSQFATDFPNDDISLEGE